MAFPVFDERAEDEYQRVHNRMNLNVDAFGADALSGCGLDEYGDGEIKSHSDGSSVL